jgi:hypothetical protein
VLGETAPVGGIDGCSLTAGGGGVVGVVGVAGTAGTAGTADGAGCSATPGVDAAHGDEHGEQHGVCTQVVTGS